MKILVTGANGQVGWELSRRGGQKGLDIVALDRAALDITDQTSIRRETERLNVDLVINAAAYTAVDRAESESELAFSINRDGPAYLAFACAEAGVPLFHISTDYVFDGRKQAPYVETDPTSPLGVYGKSKAEGEVEIRSVLRQHMIVRASWVYGVQGRNFVKTMLRLGREEETVRVVADQHGCPTYAADLADAILKIASQFLQGEQITWGTYHYCGKGVTTWHRFAQAIFDLAAKYTSFRVKKVIPISTAEYPTLAKRPTNAVLDCSLIEKTFNISPKPWRQSLSQMIKILFSVEESRNY